MVETMARIVVTTAAVMLAAASHGLRLHQRRNCSTGPTRRHRVGRPSRNRRSSSRSSPAVSHRSLGSLDRALEHDRLQVAGDAAVVLPQWRRRLVGDLVDELDLVPLGERGPQGQHLVERGAQRVDVAAAVGDAPEPLGGHEPQRPDQVVRLREIVALDQLGQAEVGDPDVALGVEQEIGRLDVAMDDPLAVGVVERIGDLGTQPGDLAEVDRIRADRRTTCCRNRRRARRRRRRPEPIGRAQSRTRPDPSGRGRGTRSAPGSHPPGLAGAVANRPVKRLRATVETGPSPRLGRLRSSPFPPVPAWLAPLACARRRRTSSSTSFRPTPAIYCMA